MIDWWAKTSTSDDYLPVAAHLRDAGQVALRLQDVALTDAQRDRMAVSFGVTPDEARALVGFLVASHDVGKIGPFQHQDLALSTRLGTRDLPGFVGAKHRHDYVGGIALHRFLIERGANRALADRLSAAICGHHSIPAAIRGPDRRAAEKNLADWWPHQEAALEGLATEFAVPAFDSVLTPSHALTLTLAGLVNVCDWTASDASRFPVTSGSRPTSRDLAMKAIVPPAWATPPAPQGASFEQTFDRAPRSAQAALVDLLEEAELPALILIEDRTGSGKTEAALWAARRALERGARGVYVGLPTRATAGQFHARAGAFLDRVWPGEAEGLRLLHGGAHLRDDGDLWPTQLSGSSDPMLAAARSWFDGVRRGLLSPFAVGTIDQALLAALSARFYPVRLWGLAGKVIVVDEAHAYDAYTGGLLASLVRWLGALDCTVIVLSATLPIRRRRELTTAYRQEGKSVDARAGSREDVPGYPRITIADRAGVRTIAINDDRPGRAFELEDHPIAGNVEALVQVVGSAVRDGGCVAVVCSTVDLAQQRFCALREATPEVRTILLHGRLRPLERSPIEDELARLVGPGATGSARPERLVVVATQIIEQSLDLDFDVMLSDLAPVDLLIQRAGRVHRHAGRPRPACHSVPRLGIMDTGAGPDVDCPLPAGSQAVYVPALLVRTRAALRDRTQIAEPEDLDALIGEVYDSDPPAGLSKREQSSLSELDADAAKRDAEFKKWAQANGIGVPNLPDPPWLNTSALADEDSGGTLKQNTAQTRWSERPSVDVVVLTPAEAALAEAPLRAANVRDLLLRAVSISRPPVVQPILEDLTAHQPASWRSHGALAHHALAVVGESSLDLDWHPELGVLA